MICVVSELAYRYLIEKNCDNIPEKAYVVDKINIEDIIKIGAKKALLGVDVYTETYNYLKVVYVRKDCELRLDLKQNCCAFIQDDIIDLNPIMLCMHTVEKLSINANIVNSCVSVTGVYVNIKCSFIDRLSIYGWLTITLDIDNSIRNGLYIVNHLGKLEIKDYDSYTHYMFNYGSHYYVNTGSNFTSGQYKYCLVVVIEGKRYVFGCGRTSCSDAFSIGINGPISTMLERQLISNGEKINGNSVLDKYKSGVHLVTEGRTAIFKIQERLYKMTF